MKRRTSTQPANATISLIWPKMLQKVNSCSNRLKSQEDQQDLKHITLLKICIPMSMNLMHQMIQQDSIRTSLFCKTTKRSWHSKMKVEWNQPFWSTRTHSISWETRILTSTFLTTLSTVVQVLIQITTWQLAQRDFVKPNCKVLFLFKIKKHLVRNKSCPSLAEKANELRALHIKKEIWEDIKVCIQLRRLWMRFTPTSNWSCPKKMRLDSGRRMVWWNRQPI